MKGNVVTGESAGGAGAALFGFKGEVQNCSFIDNFISTTSSCSGAGLNITAIGDIELRDCVFRNNHSATINWCYGGGLYLTADFGLGIIPVVRLVNCTIDNNSTTTENWSYGGGMYVNDGMSISMDSCVISNNTTNMANWSYGGGASICLESNVDISNCKFFGNSASRGQAIWYDTRSNERLTTINNSMFTRNGRVTGSSNSRSAIGADDDLELTLNNCVIANNESWSIELEGALTLNHCTVVYNGGPIQLEGGFLSGVNSIFWKNGPDQFNELHPTWVENSLSLIHI